MNKKLPNVYVNENAKKISNGSKMYYSIYQQNETILKKNPKTDGYLNKMTVNKKINDIFNKSRFIYKIKVNISTHNGNSDEVLIARTPDGLLTIDNKKIKYDEITDIKMI